MSSHGTVIDHRTGTGVRLRELDDSRRGARFSNRKEDKLLERKLTYLSNQVTKLLERKFTYLSNQNKRAQISINREKEFIRTRNPKDNDKDMNHLDRRYKEAMGFILDYKSTSVLREEQKKLARANESRNLNQAFSKCRAFNRIRSAPLHSDTAESRNRQYRHTKPLKSPPIKDAWLGKRFGKLSIDSNSLTSDSDSDSEDLFRPFSGKPKPVKPGSAGASSCSTISERRGEITPSSKHRINTSVVKNGFWNVLRNNRSNGEDKSFSGQESRYSMANTARDIMVEQRVLKLFMKVEELKPPRENKLPGI